jgi:hypothetical protein
MVEETKHDLLLKRVQIGLGIVGAAIGIVVGLYNYKKATAPEPPPVKQTYDGGEIRTALEEAGASWIRKVAKAKEE